MREIKFRGYAVEKMVNDQWLYGTGVHKTVYTDEYAEQTGVKETWFIYTDAGWEMVKPESIGQYTGLKDKNGKEIYKGDIVRIVGEQELDYGFSLDWDDKAIVKWSDTECGYYLDLINKHERHFGDDFVATKDTFPLRKWGEEEWWIEYEIVGNMYEEETS